MVRFDPPPSPHGSTGPMCTVQVNLERGINQYTTSRFHLVNLLDARLEGFVTPESFIIVSYFMRFAEYGTTLPEVDLANLVKLTMKESFKLDDKDAAENYKQYVGDYCKLNIIEFVHAVYFFAALDKEFAAEQASSG